MKIKDDYVLYSLSNHKFKVYNLWYSSFRRVKLSEFRNYNSLYISVLIVQRHLN